MKNKGLLFIIIIIIIIIIMPLRRVLTYISLLLVAKYLLNCVNKYEIQYILKYRLNGVYCYLWVLGNLNLFKILIGENVSATNFLIN